SRAAARAEKITHVLDHTEHRHVHPLEHGHAAPSIDQREILRRRNDNRALERHLLRHGELRIAGSGRHIDHHYVERAPFDLAQHLGERRDDHRPAPDHRRLLVDEEADRHDGEPVARDRLEPRAADSLRPLLDGEELGQGWTVDIGVEDPDLEAERAQTEREIDRRGRFAYPALARSDRDDRLDARYALYGLAARRAARGHGSRALRRWTSGRRARFALCRQRDESRPHARQPPPNPFPPLPPPL